VGAAAAGLTPLFVRESDLGPLASAAWRLALALIIIVPISICWKFRVPTRRIIELNAWTLSLGLLFAVDVMLWQTSITRTFVSVAAFLANLAPVFVVVYRAIIYRHSPRLYSVIAVILAIGGSYLLTSPILMTGGSNAVGAVLAICASAVFAMFLMVSERAPPAPDGLARYLGLTLWALPVAIIFAVLLENKLYPETLSAFAWLVGLAAIIHCFAFMLFFLSASRIGALSSSITNLVQPVSATILGAVIYNEPISDQTLVGMATIALSVWLVAFDTGNNQR
jgi:drug/metabolite transporter (DMT)-like permease